MFNLLSLQYTFYKETDFKELCNKLFIQLIIVINSMIHYITVAYPYESRPINSL